VTQSSVQGGRAGRRESTALSTLSSDVALLSYVARSSLARTLLVLVYRGAVLPIDHALSQVLGEVGQMRPTEDIGLDGLDHGEAGALLNDVVGRRLEPGLLEGIPRVGAGSPFFITELGRESHDSLDEALAADLVRTVTAERYETLYERFSPSRRARLHRKVAVLLEQRHAARLEEARPPGRAPRACGYAAHSVTGCGSSPFATAPPPDES
jgi:hypothetical protein